ncbi:MAG: FAD-dependent monooxygenase, partial [Acetobacteraceae bacterium]|nr:FAD-dependent monooxygenase [Acetobacteraceae bacterium]
MSLGRSAYDDMPRYAAAPVPGPRDRQAVVILGAGPVGLALALGLARHGQPCVVIEPRNQVSFGSRAVCISRRSLELLAGLDATDGLLAQGLAWTDGRSDWRGHEVLRFAMPHDADQQHPPMLNLQQCFTEQALVDAARARPEIALRWGHAMRAITPREDGVALTIAAPDGDYAIDADWVVACDGARSPTRAALGLALRGESHEGRYLIADIRADIDLPTERRAWFDPPANPGSTVLMHRQPGGIWRIDYQLLPEEDAEAAQREEAVRARVDAHLAAIGRACDYELILISLYRAHELTLDRYRHGRVLLAGDAAHLLPIFGVRGMNSGIEDAGSLAWMLAAVARDEAGAALLDAWSAERVQAARENIRQAHKSTLFMTPPTRGHALLRDAALSLAVSQGWARALVNPRQSAAVAQPDSALSTPEQGNWPAGTPGPGAVLPSVPLGQPDGTPCWLADLLAGETAVVAAGPLPGPVPARLIRIGPDGEARDGAG